MNAKSIYETLAALGAGVMIAGCTTSPAPTGGAEVKPVSSGHGTLKSDGSLITGKVGTDLDADAAKLAARQVGLAMLATIRATVGSLDRVRRIVKLTGFVASANGFTDQPKVVDAASNLLLDIFGESGRHARSAVGVAMLPRDVPVEIEFVAALHAAP